MLLFPKQRATVGPPFYPYFRVLLSVLLLAFASACGKKEEVIQNGSASGMVVDINIFTAITATSSVGGTYTATLNRSGVFTFPSLPPDAYTVRFAPAAGYSEPPPRSIRVESGKNTELGNITAAKILGTITGSFSPNSAVGLVTATAGTGAAYSVSPNATNGAYRLTLPPGTYTLTFASGGSYVAPLPVSGVAVTAGSSTAFPVVVCNPFSPQLARGTVSWTQGGTGYSANSIQCTAALNGGYLYFVGDDIRVNSSAQVSFQIPAQAPVFAGVGTYIIGNPVVGTYNTSTISGSTVTYRNYGAPANGTLTVTAFDPAARKIAGTFAYAATGTSGTAGTVSVTSGVFDISY